MVEVDSYPHGATVFQSRGQFSLCAISVSIPKAISDGGLVRLIGLPDQEVVSLGVDFYVF